MAVEREINVMQKSSGLAPVVAALAAFMLGLLAERWFAAEFPSSWVSLKKCGIFQVC